MSTKVSYSTSFKTLEGRSKFLTNQCPITMERLSCVQCKDILVDPHQADCGCRFCLNCLKTGTKICPECRTNLTSQNGVTVNYDKAAEREILQLEIKCINEECRYKCKIKDLDTHLAKCEHKKSGKIRCEDCEVEMLREDFNKSHRNVSGDNSLLCARWSGVCPYKCSEDVRGNIKRHLSECKNKPVECPMKDAGCCKVLRRGEMEAHIKEDVHEHMRLMMIQLTELKTANERLRSEYEQSNAKLENEIRMLNDDAAEKSTEIIKLTEKALSYENICEKLCREANFFKQTLNSDGIFESDLGNSASSTKDGSYVWRISNMIAKIRDAKRGVNTCILSDPFYTHIPGYKMCLKLYPAGDGKRAENHMSLYFVIMQGEYDDKVSWPFRDKVSLCLQSNHSSIKSRTINLKPDINNVCYGKPTVQCNLAAGQPKFISHVELISTDEYIENDTIVISARVF